MKCHLCPTLINKNRDKWCYWNYEGTETVHQTCYSHYMGKTTCVACDFDFDQDYSRCKKCKHARGNHCCEFVSQKKLECLKCNCKGYTTK